MISLIVCSRSPSCPDSFSKHIETTIGELPYEIIWIDNSNNQRNICQAYNYGLSKARYDYLCFLHEDIIIYTNDWGKKSIDAMSDKSVGMLGVQGCVYFCESTTYWNRSLFRKANYILEKDGVKIRITEQDYPSGNDVVVIDGMWMFARAECFENSIRFDEEHFHNFHMYDMDLSLQMIKRGYKIRIIEDLWIEHLSMGNYDKSFFEDNQIFHEK